MTGEQVTLTGDPVNTDTDTPKPVNTLLASVDSDEDGGEA